MPNNRVGYSAPVASEHEYDLLVIGSGPGGQKAAVAAAKLGKSVAVIEHRQMLGGVCVNTGAIPSKTLREAVVHLTGMNQRELYGASYRVNEKIAPADPRAHRSRCEERNRRHQGPTGGHRIHNSPGMGASPMCTLRFHLRDLAVTFRFGEEVSSVDIGTSGALTRLAKVRR